VGGLHGLLTSAGAAWRRHSTDEDARVPKTDCVRSWDPQPAAAAQAETLNPNGGVRTVDRKTEARGRASAGRSSRTTVLFDWCRRRQRCRETEAPPHECGDGKKSFPIGCPWACEQANSSSAVGKWQANPLSRTAWSEWYSSIWFGSTGYCKIPRLT
jgi:hypothetical protein